MVLVYYYYLLYYVKWKVLFGVIDTKIPGQLSTTQNHDIN